MNYEAQKWLLFFSIFAIYHNINTISIVYNFRIAQITKQPISESDERHHSVIGLIFDQYRKKYTGGIRQNFIGALSSYIYSSRPYYFRTDFALSHIKQTTKSVKTFSGIETDDILFTLGRNVRDSKYTPLTLSGLFGIPTHRIFRLQHIDFGYSQVGLGAQLDGLYQFNDSNALIYGGRYIYFVPQKALDTSNKKHTFSIGNVLDFLLAYKSNWNNHGVEFGFTERFRIGAHIYPLLDDIIKKTNYIRSNFYLVYKYKFLIRDVYNRLLFNIAYGFDSSSRIFGNKYIIFLWSSWHINF